MSYMYDTRRRADSKAQAEKKNSFASGPSMDALRSGMAKPSAEQMGSRVDIPEALRARFEESFGADLSSVKLYQSQAVADAGANAVAQGSNIAFAPGKLDFSSFGGKALLGHELSHVVSQQRGEVRGGGFLENPALEARADREGAMAAAGQTVYGGAAAPLSPVSAAPAAGPMQAAKPKSEKKDAQLRSQINDVGPLLPESDDKKQSNYMPQIDNAGPPLSKAEKKRRKQVQENVDRLYRIQAAMMRGDAEEAGAKNPLLKEGDYEWYQDMLQNADLDTFTEIRNRGLQSAKKLVDFRDSMQDDELMAGRDLQGKDRKKMKQSQKNYFASFSDEALDYDIYTRMANSLTNSKGAKEKVKQENKEKRARMAEYKERRKTDKNAALEYTPEEKMILEANDIQNSAFMVGNGQDVNSNKNARFYLALRQSKEGRRSDDIRQETRLKRFDDIAMGGKKKKKTKEEMEKEKQIQRDINKLYAHTAAVESDTKLSKEEQQNYNSLIHDKTKQKDLLIGLMDRMNAANTKLGENWEKAGGKNLDKKTSYEKTQTDQAQIDYQVYQTLFNELGGEMNPDELNQVTADYSAQKSTNYLEASKKGNTAREHTAGYGNSVEGDAFQDTFMPELKKRYKKAYKKYR